MVVVCATKTKEARTWQRNGQMVKETSESARMDAGKGDTQPVTMKTICHNFYGTIIFNASALQEELGYSSGWQRILVQLVVACSLRLVDMGSVCSCRICFEVRKEFGKYFSIG